MNSVKLSDNERRALHSKAMLIYTPDGDFQGAEFEELVLFIETLINTNNEGA
tara:strand:- start:31 stop:186 length:156 start_codon:yes stop_codon:yes gene_type:complete